MWLAPVRRAVMRLADSAAALAPSGAFWVSHVFTPMRWTALANGPSEGREAVFRDSEMARGRSPTSDVLRRTAGLGRHGDRMNRPTAA